MFSSKKGEGATGRRARSWFSNSDSFIFIWFEDAAQAVEGVAIAGGDGIDRIAQRGGDFGKTEFAPDAEHEHFALRIGQMIQRGADEFGILALLDGWVEEWFIWIGRDDLFTTSAARIGADKVQRAGADSGIKERVMFRRSVGPVPPEFDERGLHHVFGIRHGGDPLSREKQQLWSDLRVADSPRLIVGWLGIGPIHFQYRKRRTPPILSGKMWPAASARCAIEKGKRLIVAATLEKMRELGVDRWRQPAFQRGDFLRSRAQFFQMQRGIAREKGAVGDDGDALAERGGEFVKDGRFSHAAKVLDGPRVVHCDPAKHAMNLKKSILVVDDDVDILRLAREALGTIEGCIVETTPNAEYAFELVLKKNYDLLIFDMTMPDLSGAVLYSLIRTLFRVALPDDRKLPPLVLMSGASANRRAQELLREPGVRAFIPKPFTLSRFVGTVEQILAG